jgi:nicotinate-nucleotide pyrophosphorylase (carboxylating)
MEIVLSGLPIVSAILKHTQSHCEMHTEYTEGDVIAPGAVLLSLSGPAKNLLMLERIILNFLQRLCAIATLTAKYVNKIKHTSLKILDTRKTSPGMRHLEKYAVFCGGGVNHRMGLYDAIMIKDTHIDLYSGMDKVLEIINQTNTHLPIIIEVRYLSELDVVLNKSKKIYRVLLDNMTISQLKECVTKCRKKIATEASGNITLDNIEAIATTGVDFASIGAITHSAGVVDLSMQVTRGVIPG